MVLTVDQTYSQREVDEWLLSPPIVEDTGCRVVETRHGIAGFFAVTAPRSFGDEGDTRRGCSSFVAPERLMWQPTEQWLSEQRTLLGGGSVIPLRRILGRLLLFVNAPVSVGWRHVGFAQLTQSASKNGSTYRYGFRVEPRLGMALWVAVGGYADWLLALGTHEYKISVAGEVTAIVRRDWGRIAPDVRLLRYRGDSFLAATNDTGLAVVLYDRGKEILLSDNADYEGDGEERYCFLTSGGHEVDVPRRAIVSRDTALGLIERYVENGEPAGLRPLR